MATPQLDLPFGVYVSNRIDLDAKFRVINDAARDSLIIKDIIKAGHIIYHELDKKLYFLKTYPTYGDTTGVVWEELVKEQSNGSFKKDDRGNFIIENFTTESLAFGKGNYPNLPFQSIFGSYAEQYFNENNTQYNNDKRLFVIGSGYKLNDTTYTFSDYFVPSINELMTLIDVYNDLSLENVFTNNGGNKIQESLNYWSSTASNITTAYVVAGNFFPPIKLQELKLSTACNTRFIRKERVSILDVDKYIIGNYYKELGGVLFEKNSNTLKLAALKEGLRNQRWIDIDVDNPNGENQEQSINTLGNGEKNSQSMIDELVNFNIGKRSKYFEETVFNADIIVRKDAFYSTRNGKLFMPLDAEEITEPKQLVNLEYLEKNIPSLNKSNNFKGNQNIDGKLSVKNIDTDNYTSVGLFAQNGRGENIAPLTFSTYELEDSNAYLMSDNDLVLDNSSAVLKDILTIGTQYVANIEVEGDWQQMNVGVYVGAEDMFPNYLITGTGSFSVYGTAISKDFKLSTKELNGIAINGFYHAGSVATIKKVEIFPNLQNIVKKRVLGNLAFLNSNQLVKDTSFELIDSYNVYLLTVTPSLAGKVYATRTNNLTQNVEIILQSNSLTKDGDICYFDQLGTAKIEFKPYDSNVQIMINSTRKALTNGQYSRVAVHKVDHGQYRIFGELAEID